MDQLLSVLHDSLDATSQSERERIFLQKFRHESRSLLTRYFYSSLDYHCDPRQDDWTEMISLLIPNALSECLCSARADEIRQLEQFHSANPGYELGELSFEPFAAAITHDIVRSADLETLHKSPKPLGPQESGFRDTDAAAANPKTKRQYDPLELELGPKMAPGESQFADAVVRWEFDDAVWMNAKLPKPNDYRQSPERHYHENWKLLRANAIRRLTQKQFVETDSVTLIDRALQKALNSQTKDNRPVGNPDTYLTAAINKLILDNQLKAKRNIPLGKKTDSLGNESLIEDVDDSLIHDRPSAFSLTTSNWELFRTTVQSTARLTEELLIAEMWDGFKPAHIAQKLFYVFKEIWSRKVVYRERSKAHLAAQTALEEKLRELGE